MIFLSLNTFELGLLDRIQELFSCPALDFFFSHITVLGNGGIFWILLSILFLCIPKTRRWGLSMGFALIFCLIAGNFLLKPLINRIRPFALNESVQLIIQAPKDASFPSGHTYCSFASAFVLLGYNKKAGVAALVLAILIALSRLYLYVHYPTDVLAGVVMGFLAAWAARRLTDRLLRRPAPKTAE